MKLNELKDKDGAVHARKRVGRGPGSGTGTTAGRGNKGQKSRSGVSIKGFEGGQMPIHRRLPKRGFNNIFRQRYNEVSLTRLQTAIDAGKLDPKTPITVETMKAAGIVTKLRDGVRVLGGELTAKLDLQVAGASKPAIAAIEKVGGSITILASTSKDAGEAKAD